MLLSNLPVKCETRLQSLTGSYVKYETAQIGRAISGQVTNMPKCLVHACVFASRVREDQPFWLRVQMSDL